MYSFHVVALFGAKGLLICPTEIHFQTDQLKAWGEKSVVSGQSCMSRIYRSLNELSMVYVYAFLLTESVQGIC